jgi:hypothetical protein
MVVASIVFVSDVSPYETLSNRESKLLHVDKRSDIGHQLSDMYL